MNIERKIKTAVADKVDALATKVELIKWMFICWIGQIAATSGFIWLFLKK